MPRNVLIGTLGASPGIVTCTLDCFLEKHTPPIQFDKIILVTTNNKKVTQGYEELKEHLDRGECPICSKRYSGLEIVFDTVGVPEILTEADNNEILSKILGHLRRESLKDTDIYLSLSGGRKQMSAILAFAGMLFPVAGLYHVTPTDDIIPIRAAEELKRKREQGQPIPPELTWHYDVEKEFHIVRLPFIGFTPFFEAFVHLARRWTGISEQPEQLMKEVEAERQKVEAWLGGMMQNSDFVESVDHLYQVLQTPITELTARELLRLEQNEPRFWHACIKHGVNDPKCTIPQLKTKWEEQKALFIANKVADPLFGEFDAIFKDDVIQKYVVRERFKQLHQQLNQKICDNLRAVSENMEDWIKRLADDAKEETNRLAFEFHYNDGATQDIVICTGPELDIVIKEVLINALKHGSSLATIDVNPTGIIISNDGDFDRKKWNESLRARDTQRICNDYNLKFDIGSTADGTVRATISWGQFRHANLPINAQTIVEGGGYVDAERAGS